MIFHLSRFNWYKPIILLIISSHLVGCYNWQLIQRPFENSIFEDPSEPLLVKLKNGEEYYIYRAKIESDSLHGEILRVDWFSKRYEEVSFSTDDVAEIRFRAINSTQTIIIISLCAALVTTVVVVALSFQDFDLEWDNY